MPVVRFKLSEVSEGEGLQLEHEGRTFAVFKVEGRHYCVQGTCPHRGGPLGEGYVEDTIVTCPWHGWQYDVETGVNMMNPDPDHALKTYKVKISGNEGVIEYED